MFVCLGRYGGAVQEKRARLQVDEEEDGTLGDLNTNAHTRAAPTLTHPPSTNPHTLPDRERMTGLGHRKRSGMEKKRKDM